METTNFLGILSAQGLPGSSLVFIFAAGCVIGSLVNRAWLIRREAPHNTVALPDESEQLANLLALMGDNFPGALVKLEKREAEWFFTVASKGLSMNGPGWGVLETLMTPMPLNQVFEEAEVGVLADVLDTAALLNLPVNYECRLKSETSERCSIALMLSADMKAASPLMRGIIISTVERKLLEQELHEEKQFAEQVLEYSGAVFSVRDRDAKLIRTNKTFLDIGGYTPEEMYFSDGDQHLIGESYHAVMNQFSKVLAGDYPQIYENPWYCKDGSKRTLRWTNTGLKNADDEVDYIISVGVDITDLRLLEQRLKDRIGTFEALFENSLVGIALVKGRSIVQANQVCAEILGYTAADISGLDLEGLFDNPAACRQFIEEVVPRITWGLRHFDQTFRKKNGKHGDFRLSVSPITLGTLEDGVIVVLDDVSEIKMVERALQRSEARFRTIFDKMASGLALINEEGYFDEVNDSWCRITGYSRDEARKLRIFDITHAEDLTKSKDIMRRFREETLDMERIEKRYICRDGKILWVDLTASVKDDKDSSDEMTYVSIINDITERKTIEEELKEMNRRLALEKNRAELLADHRMAVIDLFDTFRHSQSIEDLQGILKNNLSRFVKYRDLMIALRISRSNPGYVIKDLLNETPETEILEMLRDGRGIIGSVIQNRRIYLSNDVRTDSVFIPHHPDVRSYLAFPIIYKDFLWGVIGLDHFDTGHFTEVDVEILTIVGTLIAMQLEEMTAKLALHQESDRLRILHDLVQEMAQARSNEDIHRIICSGGLFSAVHIYTVGSCGKLNTCICPNCAAQGAAIPMQSQELDRTPQVIWKTQDVYNLALQICYNTKLMGVLRVCSELPFVNQEVELASILAEQTGVFWELNNLIAQREREAMIDPLTAVWNRRYMIARLEQEDERIFLLGGQACVAILDMGDFKLINDLYGHVKGDEVLTSVARKIERVVRKTDYVGRYGGDEFILFLPETDILGAEQLLIKIRDGISSLMIEGLHHQVEIDCGVAVVPGDDSSLMGAVRTADERMYFNKRERKRRTLLTQ